MFDIYQPNEWQFIDPELNLIFPWYTKSFLDELVTWDLLDKEVLEIGGGFSTIWWNNKCHHVHTIENNKFWAQQIKDFYSNVNILDNIIPNKKYDIIIIDNDDCDRDDMILLALELIKDNGIIICDNWMQPEVWISKTPHLLERFEHKIFKQPNHPNWQTAYFVINKNK